MLQSGAFWIPRPEVDRYVDGMSPPPTAGSLEGIGPTNRLKGPPAFHEKTAVTSAITQGYQLRRLQGLPGQLASVYSGQLWVTGS